MTVDEFISIIGGFKEAVKQQNDIMYQLPPYTQIPLKQQLETFYNQSEYKYFVTAKCVYDLKGRKWRTSAAARGANKEKE